MKYSKKAVAVFMSATLVSSSLIMTGCGNKDDNKVDEDSLWYSTSKMTIGQQYSEMEDIQSFSSSYIGSIDDKLVFLTMGNYYRDTVDEHEGLDANNDFLYALDIYGTDGTHINSFEINQAISDNDPHAASGPDDMYYGAFTTWGCIKDDQAAIQIGDAEYIFDEDTGELVSAQLMSDGDYLQPETDRYEFAGYTVDSTYEFTAEGSTIRIDITDPEGNTSSFDLADKIPSFQDGDYIDGMLYEGNDKAVFALTGYDRNSTICEMDLTTCEISEYTGETAWFRDDFYTAAYFDGVGNVIVNQTGIRKLDFDACEKTEVFSFDSCNINRYDASGLTLLEMDDERIIMSGEKFDGNSCYSDMSGESDIYVLTRQDTNPNAGKTILTAATLESFDYAFCEAVCEYNETDPDYFIRLEDKYSTDARYINGELDSESDNRNEEYLASSGELSNLLMVDLISGDGPDMIVNGGAYSQLNSEDYLLDLSEDIDTTGLFANVVEAAKIDGKIYQFPLAVKVSGIAALKSDVDPDQAGFDFTQYEEFVSGPCNGTDPVGIGKLDFFTTAMASICHECIEGGTADFDDEGFRSLAQYVKDNVADRPEGSDEEEIVYVEAVPAGQMSADYIPDLSFDYMMYVYSDSISDITVMGLPSPDGRGPGLSICSSVGISAKTEYPEVCKYFIGTLLSDDIQYTFGRFDGGTPVRKSSFEDAAHEVIDRYNAIYERYSRVYTVPELRLLNFPWYTVDYSAIDEYESMLESCSYIDSVDPAIAMIIREEMPAYFTGQKTLDEVISLINDRAQTFLSERN